MILIVSAAKWGWEVELINSEEQYVKPFIFPHLAWVVQDLVLSIAYRKEAGHIFKTM